MNATNRKITVRWDWMTGEFGVYERIDGEWWVLDTYEQVNDAVERAWAIRLGY